MTTTISRFTALNVVLVVTALPSVTLLRLALWG
jgi:hypothetical protein